MTEVTSNFIAEYFRIKIKPKDLKLHKERKAKVYNAGKVPIQFMYESGKPQSPD